MAQWLGQFSGSTHATKVAELEAALRRAVAALREAEGTDAAGSKAKAARRLAERLFAARLRMVRARLDAEPPAASAEREARPRRDALRLRKLAMQAEGVDGILAEFNILGERPAG